MTPTSFSDPGSSFRVRSRTHIEARANGLSRRGRDGGEEEMALMTHKRGLLSDESCEPARTASVRASTRERDVIARSCVELTCALDGLSHRVDDADYGVGMSGRHGRYRAICGRSVLASSLCALPGPPCSTCHDVIVRTARRRVGRPPGRTSRRRRRWARFNSPGSWHRLDFSSIFAQMFTEGR